MKARFLIFITLLIVLSAAYIFFVRFEGEQPTISLDLPSTSIGQSCEIAIQAADEKSGLRRVQVQIIKNGKESNLFEKDFAATGLFRGGQEHETSFSITVEPKKLGMADGDALLRLDAWDHSLRGLITGNHVRIEKPVSIDSRPPGVDVLTRAHNITPGGAGLVVYKLSESCSETGVMVGETFYPGHSGAFSDPNIVMAFFALDYNQGRGTEIYVSATDAAGNTARAGFPYYIKKKTFKTDAIPISDRFLTWKMPEFSVPLIEESNTPLLDKFLKINREMRKANYDEITGLGVSTDPIIHWENAFLRLPKSARRANFADHREYLYNGKLVDKQVHLGIDLASIAHSPVPAANSGKVVFVGEIGIYGKTIVIDHGVGLFSTYSHLSSMDVEPGRMVTKGDVIGKTGSTGMAAGDHLHYGMMIHKTFVNPVEWWDAAWIKNNVLTKIKDVKDQLNQP